MIKTRWAPGFWIGKNIKVLEIRFCVVGYLEFSFIYDPKIVLLNYL